MLKGEAAFAEACVMILPIEKIDPYYLIGIFNSQLAGWWFRKQRHQGDQLQIDVKQINEFPLLLVAERPSAAYPKAKEQAEAGAEIDTRKLMRGDLALVEPVFASLEDLRAPGQGADSRERQDQRGRPEKDRDDVSSHHIPTTDHEDDGDQRADQGPRDGTGGAERARGFARLAHVLGRYANVIRRDPGRIKSARRLDRLLVVAE